MQVLSFTREGAKTLEPFWDKSTVLLTWFGGLQVTACPNMGMHVIVIQSRLLLPLLSQVPSCSAGLPSLSFTPCGPAVGTVASQRRWWAWSRGSATSTALSTLSSTPFSTPNSGTFSKSFCIAAAPREPEEEEEAAAGAGSHVQQQEMSVAVGM